MEFIPQRPHKPMMSIILLIILGLGISIVMQGIVMIWFGLINKDTETAVDSIMSDPYFGKLLLAVSSVATFGLPAYLLYHIEKKSVAYFPQEKPFRIFYFVVMFAVLFAFMPMMNLIGDWNAKLTLPEPLSDIEQWMRESENSKSGMISNIVMETSWGGLCLNLLILAVLPGICEELFFRGGIQKNLEEQFGNSHLAIWLTAIVFSAIHVQFYGFFPRMILGVLFGYALLWSQNIWVPIFAHFVNNATATLVAFYYARNGKSYEDFHTFESYPAIVYVGSLIITATLIFIFYNYSKKITNGKRLGED